MQNVWIVQFDQRDKEEGNCGGDVHVFAKREDAFSYAIRLIKNINQEQRIKYKELGDDSTIICPHCVDNCLCTECDWCSVRMNDDETRQFMCLNEEKLYQSNQTHFYFKARDDEKRIYNPVMYDIILKLCRVY